MRDMSRLDAIKVIKAFAQTARNNMVEGNADEGIEIPEKEVWNII